MKKKQCKECASVALWNLEYHLNEIFLDADYHRQQARPPPNAHRFFLVGDVKPDRISARLRFRAAFRVFSSHKITPDAELSGNKKEFIKILVLFILIWLYDPASLELQWVLFFEMNYLNQIYIKIHSFIIL